jgi:4'-phosphopantetheinyl transferase
VSTGGIDVYWLECGTADLPADDRWLAESELRALHAFRVPKRRDDWRLGRWAAKQAVAAFLRMPPGPASLAAIEIRPADSGAPEVFLPSGPAPVSISISHCNGIAACAVTQHGVAVGCDLEAIEPRSDAFVADYFLECERAQIAREPSDDRPRLTTLLWSAKESALKALHEGLRLDTRSVEAQPDLSSTGEEWRPVTVLGGEGRRFNGWWRGDGRVIRTILSDPAPALPLFIRLQ